MYDTDNPLEGKNFLALSELWVIHTLPLCLPSKQVFFMGQQFGFFPKFVSSFKLCTMFPTIYHLAPTCFVSLGNLIFANVKRLCNERI